MASIKRFSAAVLMLGATAFGLLVTSSAAYAQGSVTVTDPPGNVYTSTNGTTTNEAADVETATASYQNATISLSLSTYGNPNPSTDPGWQNNNAVTAYTYVAWVLQTSTAEYVAYFDTNANPGEPSGGLNGELTVDTAARSEVTSCDVTPSYSNPVGYQLSFASSCIGDPGSFNWYSYIIYRPGGSPADYFVGKAAPEEPENPKSATYAGQAVYAPTVTAVTAPGHSVQDEEIPNGYRLVAKDGGVFAFGGAHFYGSTGGTKLNEPIVGAAATPDTKGYWLVASDGGMFSFGDAQFYGSTGSTKLVRPVVGMTSTVDGGGYWLVASDGGVFAFGDARFYGSTGGVSLDQPIVGMAATPDYKGYWLVAADGGVFAFGDARFYGSTGGGKLDQPIVGMAATPDGKGYWLVAADGGIFSYGDARFYGSTGGVSLDQPIVGMAATPDGKGYWLVAADGGIFSYGNAPFFGSTGNIRLNQPIVAITTSSVEASNS